MLRRLGVLSQPFSLTSGVVAAAIFFFSLLSVVPLATWEFGGDIMFQYVAIECFASQFWQGDLYPHWCYSANSGLGAPVFLFYFPLPFYVASLFYPLTWLGGHVEHVYLLSVWLATFVTGLTAWHWLRDLVPSSSNGGRIAVILALVYLWMPYRMEVMLFRSAYSELWALAWMPLVCKYARRLAQGERAALPMLALAFSLTFISNMPAAVIGVLMAGGYSLLMVTRAHPKGLLDFALALLWGAALAAFYLGPAILYKPFITTEGVIGGKRSWSNDFLSMINVTEHGQGQVVVAIALMLAAAVGMALYAVLKRKRLPLPFMQREVLVWAALMLGAIFMLFPVSKPVWNMLGFISMLAFPWRMQMMVMMAALYFAALLLGRALAPQKPPMRTGDTMLIYAMLALLGLFVVSARAPDFVTYGDKIIASRFITQREYRTIWTDKSYIAMEYLLGRYDRAGRIPAAETIEGKADSKVLAWGEGDYQLEINAKTESKLRLNLQYFPIWGASAGSGQVIELSPEKSSGQMLATVPAGHYFLSFYTRIFNLSVLKIAACITISLAAAVGWLAAYRSQLRDKQGK